MTTPRLTPHDVWLLGLAVRADKQARAKEHAALVRTVEKILAEREGSAKALAWDEAIVAVGDAWADGTPLVNPHRSAS